VRCDVCHAREATVHLTEVVNEEVTKLHLCENCAKAKSEEMQSHFGLTDLIASLMDFEPALPEEKPHEVAVKCGKCGMTYHDFQKTGKLGCEECYEAFKKDLSGLLKKIHGADRHVGKMPVMSVGTASDQETLKRLHTELEELVRAEEFEKAAIIRDRIKDLEGKS